MPCVRDTIERLISTAPVPHPHVLLLEIMVRLGILLIPRVLHIPWDYTLYPRYNQKIDVHSAITSSTRPMGTSWCASASCVFLGSCLSLGIMPCVRDTIERLISTVPVPCPHVLCGTPSDNGLHWDSGGHRNTFATSWCASSCVFLGIIPCIRDTSKRLISTVPVPQLHVLWLHHGARICILRIP